MAADRTALDREGEIPVSAGPDVAERGADDAPSDEIGAEAAMLLAQGLPEHDGRWVHGRHGGLGRDVDVLPPSAPLARRQGGERAESRVHAGPVRRLRKGGPNGSAAGLPREPEAPTRRGDLEIGRGHAGERSRRAVGRDGDEDRARVRRREPVVAETILGLDDDVGRGGTCGVARSPDLGPELAEDPRAVRAGIVAEVEDANPVEHYRAVSGRCARGPPPTTTSSWPPCPS